MSKKKRRSRRRHRDGGKRRSTRRTAPLSLALAGLVSAPTSTIAKEPLLAPALGYLGFAAASAPPSILDASLRDSSPPLREARDPALQRRLEQVLQTTPVQRAIDEKRFAAALVDITDLDAPRLAAVNGDLMLYSASLPKIAILLGVFQRAAEGAFSLDEATIDSSTRMIRSSSNSAATEMYNKVEPPELARILQSGRYRLYDRSLGGGLWVGKPYAKHNTWQRDPIANLSHGATAFQVARFFYLLELGSLVSPEASERMKEILSRPAIQHKFVKGLGDHRPGSEIYRKSGTWRTYHSDAGIVERDGRTYIAVMLANDPRGGEWLSQLIVDFDDLIHDDGSLPDDD